MVSRRQNALKLSKVDQGLITNWELKEYLYKKEQKVSIRESWHEAARLLLGAFPSSDEEIVKLLALLGEHSWREPGLVELFSRLVKQGVHMAKKEDKEFAFGLWGRYVLSDYLKNANVGGGSL